MKIAYLTTYFPYRPEEQFFEAEVRSLAAYADVIVVPTRARSSKLFYHGLKATPYFVGYYDRAMLVHAWREACRHPGRVIALLARLLVGRSSLRSKLVNLAVFPKASFAVASELRRLRGRSYPCELADHPGDGRRDRRRARRHSV